MKPNLYMLTVAVLLLSSGNGLLAAESAGGKAVTTSFTDASDFSDYYADSQDQPADASQEPADAKTEPADTTAAPATTSGTDYNTPLWQNNPSLAWEPLPQNNWLATRFGWWGVSSQGSKSLVGEWQGLESSSPFWDVDGLTSDGVRTFNFYANGPENEANQAGLYYYGGPGLSMDLDNDRFIQRIGHDPLSGDPTGGYAPVGGFFAVGPNQNPLPNGTQGYPMWGEDFNRGQDYAVRVQQLQANFKGKMTDNLSWRLNVWGLKKEGMRQQNAAAHCFNASSRGGGNTCHVVSNGQRIDWLTMEVEPVIAAQLTDWLTVEYSRTMRSFQQDDQMLNFTTTRGPSVGYTSRNPEYALVPENYTEIDRIKVLANVAPDTDMYVLGFVGNTHNKFRESDRKFYGADARVTNTTLDNLNVTLYGKTFTENNSADTIPLNTRYPDQASNLQETVAPPALVDRVRSAAGLKGRWRPFYDSGGLASQLAVTSGYEYSYLKRDNVTYTVVPYDPGDPSQFPTDWSTWTQPDTATNMFVVGLEQDWTSSLNSYVRYRMIDTNYPLMGVSEWAQYLNDALNTNLPARENRVEIGGTWSPADDFMLNASVWIENTYNHSEYVNFDENNYPIVLSAWYAPGDQWSFTGGYATFTNWINQDITLGNRYQDGQGYTEEWNYGGRSDVYNLGASYAWTERTTLISGVEYVRSSDGFDAPPSSARAIQLGNPYTDLPTYSAVRLNTWRLSAGVDHELSQYVNTFFRYNYYDYEDVATGWNSGSSHMFLAGLSGVF